MRRLQTKIGVVVGLLMTLAPAIASACPACYGASSERVISSYLWSAAILTLLPFALLGAGYAIAIYFRRQSDRDAAALESALPSAAPLDQPL